jgi:hypothetical protein
MIGGSLLLRSLYQNCEALMTERPRTSDGSSRDPFESIDGAGGPSDVVMKGPTAAVVRVIGASCGAFVFCFLAILATLPLLLKIGEVATSILWLVALALGAIGGAAFPRVGHFLAYTFIIFLNVMLCFTIGRNVEEQVWLFGIFALTELIFFMSHCLAKKRDA